MNERLVVWNITAVDPTEGNAVGALFAYYKLPVNAVIVYASFSPDTDDAGLTVDINDDGSGVIEAIACAVAATPGEWKSTHLGGAETPVKVAADSVISLDVNAAAVAVAVYGQLWFLTTDVWA